MKQTIDKKIDQYKKELDYLKNIIANLPGHVYWKDKDGGYLGCNLKQAKDLAFESPEEIIGKVYEEIHSQEHAKELRGVDNEVMSTDQAKTLEEPAEDGHIYLSKKIPLHNKQGEVNGILGISFDITELKQLEKQLKSAKAELEKIDREKTASLHDIFQKVTGGFIEKDQTPKEIAKNIQYYFENLIALMPGNIYWLNREGVYLGCNDNAAKYLKLASRRDIVGKTYEDLYDAKYVKTLRHIDNEVMQTGKLKTIEESAVLEGGTEAIFLSNKVPTYNKEREVVGLLGISVDITGRKKAEKKIREAKIKEKAHKERIETLESIGAAIAHELSTPIKAIEQLASGIGDFLPRLLQTYQIAKEAKLDIPHIQPRHFELLKIAPSTIEEQMLLARNIMELFLTNIKPIEMSGTTFQRYTVNSCIDEALKHYPLSHLERAKIHWDKTHDFIFFGERLLVIRILSNLLKNALYYVAKAKKGDIRIWVETGKRINTLYFEDTGTGIAKEILPKIFDQFFTRTTHRGTGIGLYFCKNAMKKMNGNIVCSSEEGEFTKFALTFPVIKKSQNKGKKQ